MSEETGHLLAEKVEDNIQNAPKSTRWFLPSSNRCLKKFNVIVEAEMMQQHSISHGVKHPGRIVFCIVLLTVVHSSILFAQDQDLPTHFHELTKTFPETVLLKGDGNSKTLALTFDDGPTELTIDILNILLKHQVKATFFWQGNKMAQHPEIVCRALEEGHVIGNHSWDHPNGIAMEPHKLWESQVVPTMNQYRAITGKDLFLYRPPFGAISGPQASFLKDQGMFIILWSHSTMDWDSEQNSCDDLSRRFKKGLHQEGIVLMHDMDFDGSGSEKLCGLEGIIQYSRRKGYEFLTINKLLK